MVNYGNCISTNNGAFLQAPKKSYTKQIFYSSKTIMKKRHSLTLMLAAVMMAKLRAIGDNPFFDIKSGKLLPKEIELEKIK